MVIIEKYMCTLFLKPHRFTEADPLVMGLDCIHIAFKIVFNSQNKGILWQSNGSVAGQNLDPLCPPKLN